MFHFAGQRIRIALALDRPRQDNAFALLMFYPAGKRIRAVLLQARTVHARCSGLILQDNAFRAVVFRDSQCIRAALV